MNFMLPQLISNPSTHLFNYTDVLEGRVLTKSETVMAITGWYLEIERFTRELNVGL